MAAVGSTVGLNYKLYRNTSGNYATPTWTVVNTVRDLTLNITKANADADARLSSWKGHVPTLKDASLEFELLRTRLIGDNDAFRDAFLNDTIMDMAVADQLINNNGCEYWRADMFVMEFSRKEPLEGAVTTQIKMMPYVNDHTPAFSTV
jgi:hypothetical protein